MSPSSGARVGIGGPRVVAPTFRTLYERIMLLASQGIGYMQAKSSHTVAPWGGVIHYE